MDIKHKQHEHKDKNENKTLHKMQRVYVRTGKVYEPVGWRCLTCGTMESE